MLGYKCRDCEKVKFADGQDCKCGTSWGSLKVIRLDEREIRKPKEKKAYEG